MIDEDVMNLHIVAPASGAFREVDYLAVVRRRRHSLFIIVGLSVLSWALIGALVWELA